LVAIERYTYLDDKPVSGAKRNLKDWQLYLTQTRGVPVENVTLLRDDQATREKILNAAADTAKRAQAGGTVWFLFIGHGAPATGKKTGGVLLGVDTQNDADSLMARGVLQSELLAILGKSRQTRTVAILDSCFSGRSNTGSTLVAGLQPIVATRIDAVVATGAIVLAAAQGNEYAGPLPGGNRPAFSYLTLAALRGWGDSNRDGKVTISEATQYARRVLQALLVGRHQTPEMAGAGDSVVVASAGEGGPDLAAWQRMMDTTTEAPGERPPTTLRDHPPAAQSVALRQPSRVCGPNQVLIPGSKTSTIALSPYCIDRTEITVLEYRACVQAGGCLPTAPQEGWDCNWGKGGVDQHPINCVDWQMADSYCKWTGGRLPTHAEWEYSARGVEKRTYPWGTELPRPGLLNACGSECVGFWKRHYSVDVAGMYAGSDGWQTTSPVGSFPHGASPFGLVDMAGNVSEWTADAVVKRGKTERTVCGSSWTDYNDHFPWSAGCIELDPSFALDSTGFRCARSIAD
jgi:formylglycine-generating enzyme required for sulfatase activity